MYVGSLVESIIPRRGSRFHVQTCVSFIDRVFVCSSIRIVHWVNEWVNVNDEWVRVRVCVCGLPFLPSSFSHPQLQLASSWWVGRSVGRNIFNYSHVACVVTGMMQVVWRVCGDVVLWWWFVCVFMLLLVILRMLLLLLTTCVCVEGGHTIHTWSHSIASTKMMHLCIWIRWFVEDWREEWRNGGRGPHDVGRMWRMGWEWLRRGYYSRLRCYLRRSPRLGAVRLARSVGRVRVGIIAAAVISLS